MDETSGTRKMKRETSLEVRMARIAETRTEKIKQIINERYAERFTQSQTIVN